MAIIILLGATKILQLPGSHSPGGPRQGPSLTIQNIIAISSSLLQQEWDVVISSTYCHDRQLVVQQCGEIVTKNVRYYDKYLVRCNS
jgi:hypothetical protein